MGKISNYEKKFRKNGYAIFQIVGIALDLDEVREGGWDVNAIKTKLEANWEDDIWNCYEMEEDFSATTIYNVKKNISKFYRADPAIISFKKVNVILIK